MKPVAATALVLIFSTQQALACACCAERGERALGPVSVSDYIGDELRGLSTAGPATVFTTACGLECAEGLRDDIYAYDLSFDWGHNWLTLTSTAPAGTLALHLPEDAEWFRVDTQPLSDTTTVTLYSEMRLRGEIRATGAFHAADGAEGELIIAGTSNACWSAYGATSWSVNAVGEGVDFRLFGAVVGG